MIGWYYLVLISSVLMGISTVAEKKMLKAEHATQYSTAFSWMIVLVSIILIPFMDLNVTAYEWILVMVTGLLGAITYLLSARIFKHGTISATSPLISALPIFFTVLFAYFFLGEHLSALQYVGIAGILLVTYLILFGRGKDGKAAKEIESNKYLYMLVAFAVVSAIGGVVGRYLLADVYANINVFTYMILSQLFTALFLTAFIIAKYDGVREIVRTIGKDSRPILLIVLLTVGYRLTYYFALHVAPVSIASPLRNTFMVIITVLSGGAMFKEHSIKRKLMLSIVMLLFAYLLTL
ncbi:MAG: EamA family transporter [Candidatus Micrarchaeota archaeon]|nr:EamA family transporter [Candidatus Micrarchaeota archaeon]MDE1847541.1 EamA family transporter [Candidatus Micrarchaeota archaeon]MDE1864258.1 EamA family transporter [Candidatus Micrarchaeota archaeon]